MRKKIWCSIMIAFLLTCTHIPIYGQSLTYEQVTAEWELDKMPHLHDDILSGQQSSYGRTTSRSPDAYWPASAACNVDWYEKGKYDNVLYHENGEAVLFEKQGPGVVNRIWLTLSENDPNSNIKIYFDGETTPRINMPIKNMFNNSATPFLNPLSVNNDLSSGGFVSYVPLLYNESIKITVNENIKGKIYYNIGYNSFDVDDDVTSYTGNDDLSSIINNWKKVGSDPKDSSQNTLIEGQVSLNNVEKKILAELSGPKVINAIELQDENKQKITDDGRAFKGYNQFTMTIDPNNSGVQLVRRMDYQIGDQKAKVYVDNAYVGEWFTEGKTTSPHYRHMTFDIPKSFTQNKSTITIKIEFVSAAIDWNEFHYWTYCRGILTDTLNVGNTQSESSHQYTIHNQSWSGSRTYYDKTNDYPIEEDGKAFTGYSQFRVKINANNTGVTLVRRLDYGIGNQKAKVYVDNNYVGEWFNPSRVANNFLDSSFQIPNSFTQNKDYITVKIEYISSDVDWNEFYYWVYCDGNITDAIDIGNSDSETDHQYSIHQQKWSGSRSYMLYESMDNYLNNTWINIYWDNETTPSIQAPIGAFFAGGSIGEGRVKALPVGMEDGRMYMYFPMPFASKAKIELESKTAENKANFSYKIQHAPFNGSFDDIGYFKTQYNKQLPTQDNVDVTLLSTTGRGKLVGVVETGIQIVKAQSWDGWFLEGDERIYIDGNRTPSLHGTGTEDFYNGGWYYKHGAYTNAMSGCAKTNKPLVPTQVAQYRFFVHDAIHFRNGMDAYIEHGGSDDTVTNIWALAYYYHQLEATLELTDTLDVGNSTSEQSHTYTVHNSVGNVQNKTAYFEGVDYGTQVTEEGRSFQGYSQFNVNINSANKGVLLRRLFDYSKYNQKAKVYVDGNEVGIWYNAGHNPFAQWREDDFCIPAAYTRGKTSLTIKIEYMNATSSTEWNEYTYKVFSLK